MPPKKGGDKISKKTEQKKKEKVIEDKTFGLKNKKGAKSQKFIAQVEKQVKQGGDPRARKLEEERLAEKKRKEELKKAEEEKKAIFRPVTTQRVEQGADPKSVFCAFFKQGLCKKGDKCKFSHDPDVERKSARRNIYTDARDSVNAEDENMDDWDDEKLADVVNKKHAGERANQTDIICKYFIEAVENSKYGWFWNCPNGGKNCMYRHALPPGFVLKKDKKREEKQVEISIEEVIEQKRAELSAKSSSFTPVTLQTFVEWKKRKLREKAESEKNEREKKREKMTAGLTVGLSGREMFTLDPKLVAVEDDDEDGGETYDLSKMSRENGENEADDSVKVHEIKFDKYGIMDDGVDESTEEQLAKERAQNKSDGGAAGPIDEDLFEDEDLEELEEDLQNLDV